MEGGQESIEDRAKGGAPVHPVGQGWVEGEESLEEEGRWETRKPREQGGKGGCGEQSQKLLVGTQRREPEQPLICHMKSHRTSARANSTAWLE